PGERARALAALASEPRTIVLFEAPHRLEALLAALVEAFGADRRAAVCRELTKTHEEVLRGPLQELLTWARSGQVRGEIVVVVAGAPAPAGQIDEAMVAGVRARVDGGERLKDVVAEVAAATGVGRRELYAAAVAGAH
ncbi:SAM-dependent methyltransferase, partial [Cellulomonas citrea]|uniref:SAM-dependent methyltransferase n=1 Tax=Cellulomonas citrea TaxID=1909423 RepID=UPI001F345682